MRGFEERERVGGLSHLRKPLILAFNLFGTKPYIVNGINGKPDAIRAVNGALAPDRVDGNSPLDACLYQFEPGSETPGVPASVTEPRFLHVRVGDQLRKPRTGIVLVELTVGVGIACGAST
jgi:hypothetical protein